MEILRVDLVEYQGKRALVTESTTFSGFLAYDILDSKTSEAVTKVLNNILRKFGLAEKINLHNGPCFRSGKFRSFCNQLDIVNITSSPYHNQRAVGTIEKILKKNAGDTDTTKAMTTYHHALVSDTLPSPAELFLNSRINTSFSMIKTPVPLTDQHKIQLR